MPGLAANEPEGYATMLTREAFDARARRIELVIFDVDGVLTDGQLHYGAEGELIKRFHVHDGLGIKVLRRMSVEVGVITAKAVAPVARRMDDLGVRHYFPGQEDKRRAFKGLLKSLDLSREAVACVGDDLPDLAMMSRAGLAIAVPNAHSLVRERADWVLETPGGAGAAREVADLLLSSRMPLAEAYGHALGGLA